MISLLYLILFYFFWAILLELLCLKIYIRCVKYFRRNNGKIIGFFHPYCNAGGGGERVLWAAVRAIQNKYPLVNCVVYTGDIAHPNDILKMSETRFNIKIPRTVTIVKLRCRSFVEAKYYPFCTLLMQSIGSLILGLEALLKHPPDVFIDTMGYAWTLPLFKYLGTSKVSAYVHYPTISTDMLSVVQKRKISLNNSRLISNSWFFSYLKVIYYKIFAFIYGLAGKTAEVVMVNSSWTRGHINEIWGVPHRTFTVFPPCDTSMFNSIPLEAHVGKQKILSIAQFRPEKKHELQIRAFHSFLSSSSSLPSILVLIGSCRHEEDYMRVERLKSLCEKLGITEKVEFKINLSFQEIFQEMENASIGLHTMKDEHFGIGIVECMAAGLIMIAHDSGGPKMNIVVEYNGKKTGFLASDEKSFAQAMEQAYHMNSRDAMDIRINARESVSRFSSEKFEETFLSVFKIVM